MGSSRRLCVGVWSRSLRSSWGCCVADVCFVLVGCLLFVVSGSCSHVAIFWDWEGVHLAEVIFCFACVFVRTRNLIREEMLVEEWAIVAQQPCECCGRIAVDF